MGEAGLSPSEVGKEIAEHKHRSEHGEASGQERWVTIVEAVLLAVVAVAAILLLVVLSRFWSWEPGRAVTSRLDQTSSQVRVRFAVVILLGAAVLASAFGFEAILGTFLAGAVLAVILRGDKFEEQFRGKIEAVGFGFFVPVFFVTSGLKFSLAGLGTVTELGRIAVFFVALMLIRGLPALVFRKHLSGPEMAASGLLMATNLSFIVVAVTVGLELHAMRPVTGSALIVAGLLSAILVPALAGIILKRAEGTGPTPPPSDPEPEFISPM